MNTHTIATSLNHPGTAVIIPASWKLLLEATGETSGEWTAFDAGHSDSFSEILNPVFFGWNEDETFETFAAAAAATGFTVTNEPDGDEYPATKN